MLQAKARYVGNLLIILSLMTLILSSRIARAEVSITLDGSGTGRVFDGVGAVSGGGGTSRLLYDYPPDQQSQILDYLFKPNYGASLQILKVEIGGDTNSTNGAEASHERTPTDENYQRGYEWWLMEQAKVRNPAIKLAGLEWGAPGWFKGGFWSDDNIQYLINWIKHAQSDHNLTIDYIGGWNESGYDKAWFEKLKQALTSNGLSTKIIGVDGNGGDWGVIPDLKNDAAFKSALDVVGIHYPCGWSPGGTKADICTAPPDAINLNMPIWASENGTGDYNKGAPAISRAFNRDYIDARMTASLNWSLVASWYSTLPYAGEGLMLADEPWSGYYDVGKSIWATAQITQFVQPGWQFLDSASGYLDDNHRNGSYVALKSPSNGDYSVILETTEAVAEQTVNFTVAGGLSNGAVHVWATDMNSTDSSEWFVQQSDITPDNNSYSLTLQPGYVYTLTTTTGQSKGTQTSPASSILALPYTDDFEGYGGNGKLTHYFSDLMGAFETAGCTDGHTGTCLRQVIDTAPIPWSHGSRVDPITVMGDVRWDNYRVSVDAMLEQDGYVDLIGRWTAQNQGSGGVSAYFLQVNTSGEWSLFKQNNTRISRILASGTASFPIGFWHTLALDFNGTTVEALFDNSVIASVEDKSYDHGQVGLAVSQWQNAQFDNFSVTPAGAEQ